MTVNGIIGHTGFVGGCLTAQHTFAGQFNSRNIDQSAGATFDTLVCAAAPGSMIEANNNPEKDQAQISELCEKLSAIQARRLVLISSIAVLARFDGQDDETTQDFQQDLAYGRHRRMLEAFCQHHFDDVLILRLPALFGNGLKKNFLFDLLNPVPSMFNEAKMNAAIGSVAVRDVDVLRRVYQLNPENGMFALDRAALKKSGRQSHIENALAKNALTAVQFTHPETTFQYYGVDRLWQDIEIAQKNGLEVLHLATEPVQASVIHRAVTGHDMPMTNGRLHKEDMYSRHTKIWGKTCPYLETADVILPRVSAFFQRQIAIK